MPCIASRLTAGVRLISLFTLGTVSLQHSARPSRALAGEQATATIINLIQWDAASGGNGHWYGVLAEAHTWLEAESLAATLVLAGDNGYLATVRDSAENVFILDSVLVDLDPPTFENQFYLGGQLVDWQWTWITGEQLCQLFWDRGEPNNLPLETVISMWGPHAGPRRAPGSWNNTLPDDQDNPLARFWAVLEWGPLDTTVSIPVCGDGILECHETCDDGNTDPGDGCSSDCRLEYWPCGYVLGGDTNVDGVVTTADIIFELQWIFKGGPPPAPCMAFGDVDCSGTWTSADILALVDYIFKGGAEPCDPCLSPIAERCDY